MAEGITTIPRQRWTSVRFPVECNNIVFSLALSDAPFVVKQEELSSNAAIVSRNTMPLVRGRMAIDSDLKYSQ